VKLEILSYKMFMWVEPTEKKLSLRDFHSESHGFAFLLFHLFLLIPGDGGLLQGLIYM
jgi:hypothetical protein